MGLAREFEQKTSFSTSIQIGSSRFTTAFTHRSDLKAADPLGGHPLVAFAYLTPPSLHQAGKSPAVGQVGFFFFGPGVKKDTAYSIIDQMRSALGKKG